MKTLTPFLLLTVVLCGSLKLNLDNSISITPGQKISLPISCTGSSGRVDYQVKGLPKGLSYANGVIQGVNEANSGYYPVIIDARDQKNNFVSQIVVIKIGSAAGNQVTVTSTQSRNSGSVTASSGAVNINVITSPQQQGNQNQNYQLSGGLAATQISGPTGQQGTQSSPSNVPSPTSTSSNNPNQANQSTQPNQPNQPNQPKSGDSPKQPSLDSLLSQLAPLDMGPLLPTSPSSGQKSYPTANLPTDGDSNQPPNTTPMFIGSAQAQRLPSNKNKITADNVKATAIFERQLNANKAIANLLDIIEQLTANANAAKADIPAFDAEVKNTIAAQRVVQSKIITAENQRTRLNTAINNLNDNINILRKQLSDLEVAYKDSTESVTTKKTQLGDLLSFINKFEDSLKDVNNKIAKQKQSITNLENQLRDTQNQIQVNRQELDKKTKEAANIDVQIDISVKNIKGIDDEIADLKDKLNKAQIRKSQAEDEERRLRLIKTNAPIITAELEGRILKGTQNLDRLNQLKQAANTELINLNTNLDDVNLNLARVKSQFNQVETEIKLITGNRQDYDDAIAAKNKEITDSVANLQFLKGQVQSYDSALRNAYNEGNDANTRVQNAKQNLDALVKRWEKDSQSLSEATLNLQKARAEKQLSDLAMQELLRERSSALPYSVVPNGNGVTNAGTPTGNNPRGSPLGPLAVNNNGNNDNPFPQQAQKVDSFNNYLSSAYAQGVDPTIPSSVTRNFPFTIYRPTPGSGSSQLRNPNLGNVYIGVDGQQISGLTQDVNGMLNYVGDFSCGNAPSDLIDGTIQKVGNNAFTVETTEGLMYVVKVGSCSQAIANTPNYTLSVGDRIKLAGQAAGAGIMNLYQATCDCARCNQPK